MPSPTEISVQQLSKLIGTPNCPIIIDVRTDEDFHADPFLIPSAMRHQFDQIDTLVPKLKGASTIIYCQKGLKISQGASALLRTYGLQSETLEGGQFAWRDKGLPMVPQSQIPDKYGRDHTLWVTRHRPKIDRIACPWLIRRFVDPDAKFLFVAPSQVALVAEKFNATPFDIKDAQWGHDGDLCTFDKMVDAFGVKTPAIERLSQIIRGADTNCHNLAPECAGLLAISVGLSRLYRDDLAQLEAGMLIYDALYRWARDGFHEEHDDSATCDIVV